MARISFAQQQRMVALVGGLLVLANSASAAVILSNFDTSDDESSTLMDANNRSKAMGFQMGDASFELDSVILRLETPNPGAANFQLALHGASGSVPGPHLLTFISPEITTQGIANYTFNAPPGFTLEAGQLYWLVLRDNNTIGSDSRWISAFNPTDPDGLGRATHFGVTFDGDYTYPPTTPSFSVNTYALVAVPEPGRAALAAGLGLFAIAAIRRARH
jgi:hypothetical protein